MHPKKGGIAILIYYFKLTLMYIILREIHPFWIFSLLKLDLCLQFKSKPDETVAFLKGKLADPALKFMTQSSMLYKSNDLNFIEKEFKSFFQPMNSSQAPAEFNNLSVLPQETIKKNYPIALICFLTYYIVALEMLLL